MSSFLEFYQNIPSMISPNVFPPIGSFTIRWYSLSYILAFATVYLLVLHRYKTETQTYGHFTRKNIEDMLFYCIVGAVLGGRLGYVFIYNFDHFIDHPGEVFWPFSNGKFTGISGMAYHGGVIGVVTAYFIFIRSRKLSGLRMMDLFAPCIPLGYTWGRIGNFMNGELYGRITESPVGMYFLNSFGQPLSALRHPSQLYEAFLEGILAGLVMWLLRKKLTKPGVLSSLYLITYGLFRFIAEFFREPDEQFRDDGETIGTVLGFMTMGQILCGLMIVVGSLIFYYTHYKREESV